MAHQARRITNAPQGGFLSPRGNLGDIIAEGAAGFGEAFERGLQRRRDKPFRDAALKTAEAEAEKAESAADKLALDLGLDREAIQSSFFDENTQEFITEEGRVNLLSGMLDEGTPLPPTVSVRGKLLGLAREAGLSDDIPKFLEGQRVKREADVTKAAVGARRSLADVATVELTNLVTASGFRAIDDDGSSRELTPEEARAFSADPFSPSVRVSLPSQLEQQVQATADAFFDGDVDAARGILGLMELVLPTNKMIVDIQAVRKNMLYMGALTSQLTKAALKGMFGAALKPNEIKAFSQQITDKLRSAFSTFTGTEIRSLKGVEVDENGDPIIGRLRRLVGAAAPDAKDRIVNLPITQADIQELLTAGLTDDPASATDETLIKRALLEFFTRADPSIGQVEDAEFTFPFILASGAVSKDAPLVPLQEMIQRLALARTDMFEVQTLLQTLKGLGSTRAQPFSQTPRTPVTPDASKNGEIKAQPSELEKFLIDNLADIMNLQREN